MDSFKIKGTVLTPESGDAYTAALKLDSDPVAVVYTDIEIPLVLVYAASQTPSVEISVKGGGLGGLLWVRWASSSTSATCH